MRATIDAAGRLVVPKALRDELGFRPRTELELDAVDGRLEVVAPSRVRVEQTEHGPRFVADAAEPLTTEQVRQLLGERFPDPPLQLGEGERRALLRRLGAAAVFGGASYDGLVGLEATAHGETLLTLDRRAEQVYARLGVAARAIATG